MGKLLALDVSLCNTGWAVVNTGGIPEALCATGCIVTKPGANRKGNAAADDLRRADVIVTGLSELIIEHRPNLIVAEIPYGSQSATSARGEGTCKGILASIRRLQKVPCLWVMPQVSKEAVCGARDAAKTDVQEAVLGWWPAAVNGLKNAHIEHVADALAAVVAVRSSDLYMMISQTVEADL